MAVLVSVAAASGCDGCQDAAAVDAEIALDAPGDAAIDAPPPRCDPSKPFGNIRALDEINARNPIVDDVPSLSEDELTLYFGRRLGTTGDWDALASSSSTST